MLVIYTWWLISITQSSPSHIDVDISESCKIWLHLNFHVSVDHYFIIYRIVDGRLDVSMKIICCTFEIAGSIEPRHKCRSGHTKADEDTSTSFYTKFNQIVAFDPTFYGIFLKISSCPSHFANNFLRTILSMEKITPTYKSSFILQFIATYYREWEDSKEGRSHFWTEILYGNSHLLANLHNDWIAKKKFQVEA